VSLLDTACARVAIGSSSTPAAIEDRRHRLRELERAIAMLTRESATGMAHEEALAELRAEQAGAQETLASL
jgi:type VI secretion system protein VasG